MEVLTEADLKIMFKEMDSDKDGAIREDELLLSFEGIDKSITPELIHEIFKATDLNENGKIDFKGWFI